MRSDAPSPADLDGGRFWVECVFRRAGRESRRVVASDGRVTWQADQLPSHRVTGLVVPRLDDDGRDVSSLVAADGTVVSLTGNAVSVDGTGWRWHIGDFLVMSSHPDGAQVVIEADDLTRRIYEHQGDMASGVAGPSTIAMVLFQMFKRDGIVLTYSDRLADVRVPKGFSVGYDRGESFEELLAAWGAVLVPTPGGLHAEPAPTALISRAPSYEVRAGEDGILISAEILADRVEVFNHVVVEVAESEAVGVATQVEGEYGTRLFGTRTRRVTGLSVASRAQAQLVADVELEKNRLRRVTVPVEMLPDWRVEPFDPVTVDNGVSGERWGRFTGLSRSLVASGVMSAHVGIEG